MPAPLKLLDGFQNGCIRYIALNGASDNKGPATGKHWLILSGRITHVTGTITGLYIYDGKEFSLNTLAIFLAATATGSHPLFSAIVTDFDKAVQYHLIILTDDEHLHFAGDATSYAQIFVLEW